MLFIPVSVHTTSDCYNKERSVLYSAFIDWSFVMQAHCALCEVRTESLHIRWTNFKIISLYSIHILVFYNATTLCSL